MFTKAKENIDEELEKYATRNIIKKLEKQGVDYQELDDSDFDELVADEIKILKHDSKKIGTGIGIGLLISTITGI